jgi:predicted nucleic acid-binding Zn ribbon protein
MRDPQPLSVAISELIAKRGLASPRRSAIIEAAWSRVAGERVSRNSRVLFVRNNTIHIAVMNSALLNELVSFHSPRLLAAIQFECPESTIEKIRFQLKADSSERE